MTLIEQIEERESKNEGGAREEDVLQGRFEPKKCLKDVK